MSSAYAAEFIAWLDQELERQGWNDFQLSRRAGISHSMISRARHGFPPGWEGCEAIARALEAPPDLVFRKAGLLPPLHEDEQGFEQWRYMLAQLSEEDRQELLQIARLKLEMQERRGRGRLEMAS
jgi:transcriptional regulator with XRE-family HTH domain